MGEGEFHHLDTRIGRFRTYRFPCERTRPFLQYLLGLSGGWRPDMLDCNTRRFQALFDFAPVDCLAVFLRWAHGCIFLILIFRI